MVKFAGLCLFSFMNYNMFSTKGTWQKPTKRMKKLGSCLCIYNETSRADNINCLVSNRKHLKRRFRWWNPQVSIFFRLGIVTCFLRKVPDKGVVKNFMVRYMRNFTSKGPKFHKHPDFVNNSHAPMQKDQKRIHLTNFQFSFPVLTEIGLEQWTQR